MPPSFCWKEKQQPERPLEYINISVHFFSVILQRQIEFTSSTSYIFSGSDVVRFGDRRKSKMFSRSTAMTYIETTISLLNTWENLSALDCEVSWYLNPYAKLLRPDSSFLYGPWNTLGKSWYLWTNYILS